MSHYYEKAIYSELGIEIANELRENDYSFAVNYSDATYTFLNCPKALLAKILKVKNDKGKNSILNEFVPVLLFK